MPRRLRHSVVAAGAALLVLAQPAGAQLTTDAGSETASGGNVTATLKWDAGQFDPQHPHLTITRAGVVAFDKDIPVSQCGEGDVACVVDPTGKDDLTVTDLDGDGEPEVLVNSFTRGAHCCLNVAIYDYRAATATYGELLRTFYSAGYELKDLDKDGRPELVSRDIRFEDRYSSHAASYPPIQILAGVQSNGAFALKDVTRTFKAQIRADIKEVKKLFSYIKPKDPIPDPGGILSGYVADEYLLGQGRTGLKVLDRMIHKNAFGTRKRGASFRRTLLRDLHRFGYR